MATVYGFITNRFFVLESQMVVFFKGENISSGHLMQVFFLTVNSSLCVQSDGLEDGSNCRGGIALACLIFFLKFKNFLGYELFFGIGNPLVNTGKNENSKVRRIHFIK